ncbi:MAG: MlaD family protein [Thermoanaerobaculia bacterium]
MKFDRDDARLGLLVLLAFALFAALAFQRTLRMLFRPETVHAVHLTSTSDLAVGSEVQLQGLRVGDVRKIEMQRTGTEYSFVATFGLRRDVVLWRGTKGVVTARMMGVPVLDLRLPPVNLRLTPISAGEKIDGECGASAGTLMVELTELTNNLNVTITELRQELKTNGLASILEHPEVRRTLRDLGGTLAAFRDASRATEEAVSHGGKTLEAADRNLVSLEKSLLHVQALLERRGNDLDVAFAQLGPALEKVQKASSDLSETLLISGPQAAEDLRDLHRTLGSMQELLEVLKAKPNRIVFGKTSPKEMEAAKKKVAAAEASQTTGAPELSPR